MDMLQQAIQYHQQGNLVAAKAIYLDILQAEPQQVDCLHFLGLLAYQSGEYAQAVSLLKQTLALQPSFVAAHSNIGLALMGLQQYAEAEQAFLRALQLQPNYAEGYNNLSIAQRRLQQPEAALKSAQQAVALKSDYAEAYFNLGCAQESLEDYTAAIASFAQAAQLKAGYVEAYNRQGNLHMLQKQYMAALACFNQAIALKPDYAEPYNNRGNCYAAQKQYLQARADYATALAFKPDYAAAHNNRGNLGLVLQEYDAALSDYQKAISLQPDYPDAQTNRAMLQLLLGDFAQGWRNYEWRWRRSAVTPRFSQPAWLGEQNVSGKTILLHAEQGFGDAIQFCRYARYVADLGAKVILEVHPALLPLLQNLEGVAQLIVRSDDALPAFDYHCPLLSLPLAFKTELHNIPVAEQYLQVPASYQAKWQLPRTTRKRIGLVWRGNLAHKNDHNRSIALSEWLAYLPQQFEYICLQQEMRPEDHLPDHIQFYGEQLKDFADTAALCEQMDLVISVDTSVAHLSAALGKPTWILLPTAPDWRWMLYRQDSPWYPSVRLWRQQRDGCWHDVLAQIEKHLMCGESHH